MIEFNDNKNWLAERISHIPKSYYVPDYFNGDGVCIDIGANVGAFSIVYNDKFEKIYCFEPAEYTYNECVKNLSKYKNIEVFKFAITNESDNLVKLKSYREANYSGNASLIDSPEWNNDMNYEYVITKSFRDVIIESKIAGKKNYVKIDTEGSEYEILMNQDLSMIDFLAVEIHLQLGREKMNELRKYLLNYFNIIKDSGGETFHYETVYVNKNIKL